MNKPPQIVEAFRDFKGLYSDFDPTDVPNQGFWRMINLMQVRNGEITTRGGLQEVETEVLE